MNIQSIVNMMNEKKLLESEKLRDSYEDYYETVRNIEMHARPVIRNMSFDEAVHESICMAYKYIETGGTPDKFIPIIEKKAKRFAVRRKSKIEEREKNRQLNESDSTPGYGKGKGKGFCRKSPYVVPKITHNTEDEDHESDSIEKSKDDNPEDK